MINFMDRQRFMLTALAASDGGLHNSVQVQKLFFVLDQEIPSHVGGPYFDFIPYDYGPYDIEVYHELQHLAQQNLVAIAREPYTQGTRYRLTPKGQEIGDQCLGHMTPAVAAYIRKLSAWVRRLSFAQLVSAIYQAYPEMQVNSVFHD